MDLRPVLQVVLVDDQPAPRPPARLPEGGHRFGGRHSLIQTLLERVEGPLRGRVMRLPEHDFAGAGVPSGGGCTFSPCRYRVTEMPVKCLAGRKLPYARPAWFFRKR